MSQVEARLPIDAEMQHLVKVEKAKRITNNCEHALLYGGERDIVTVLLYTKGNSTSERARSATTGSRGRCHGRGPVSTRNVRMEAASSQSSGV